ncbi:AVAST type 4 anti-phage nuclease Avs4 [Bacillus inaquosorum]|uniref:AVAST type 4 anti-phage nuclease Avs4 n=1 Tax=Bacillus inaquosorum TaxID=483913 RepID=UPI00227F569C|nr:AVAST type 4 anti-phage nuclease Avs4 [Bacillus inaquosorum]MCY8138579.1 ATP-binding protein [Bacillus inaquosorum]MCY8280103.1 ATP-binding protein [Bacillus inaquosorum]MCY8388460.1 ATP-binding protein [Bacillus inaquosorum]MCY8727268.1 ATP-binding protein [Bacillus inaquosorum]MCY9298556.1 ATP-binding protein [Bacillus inaquosorum]
MIKPDWNIFKAKFSENPQNNFEWLCYLLFCEEFGKEFGIFRYKNQSGIETNPVDVDEEVIGWQAKFYETTLSDHKGELIKTLIKSKRDYSDLTKIIFYTNQEWGQSHNPENPEQNDPQAKVDIESKAKEIDIQIEWRTASFFESPFVTIKNGLIIQHFFSFEKSIVQLLSEKQTHAESILKDIQTSINFHGRKIEINRNALLERIISEIEKEQVLMLTGAGGIGKTAVIKRLYEDQNTNTPFYIFKASEFEINDVNNLFGGYSLQGFIEAHKEEEKKLVVIDSAEKLLDLENTDPFKEFVSVLIKNEWKFIFTARSNYLSDLDMQFIDQYQVKPIKFYIETLSEEELIGCSQVNNFNLPTDTRLLELLRNPFYLNEYLKFYNNDEVINYQNFKEKLWNKLIKKSKPTREQCFMKIAFQRASEGQFFVSPNCNESTINSLVHDGILGYETAGYFITHDIYEEWALEKIIESEFIRQENHHEFLKKIGESLPIRRSFRKWVSDKLLTEDDSIENFIEEVIEDENIPYFWKDEVLVSVLLSSYSDHFINLFEEKLLENNQKLLNRATFLLRIACKEVDEDYLKGVGLDKYSISYMQYIFTKPKGKGWESIIKLIYKNKDKIEVEKLNFILPIINEWNNKFKSGETTKLSALIALEYYQVIVKEDIYLSRGEGIEEKLIQTILYGAAEIKEELTTIFDKVIKNEWRNYRDPYYNLVNAILSKVGENQEILKSLPNYVLSLADLYWFNPQEKHHPFHYSVGVEGDFCIDENQRDYYPPSAFQTPIYWLLKYSLKETVDFLLRFINKTVECYVKSDLDKSEVKEVEVVTDSHVVKQYISNRLWNTYRGTQVSPNVFQSIHMALEKFLLETAKNTDSKILESNLLYLIKNSNSSSLTAIVVSVVLAYPEKTFNVAKVLFQTKEFFFYDSRRMILEHYAKSQYLIGAGLIPKNKIYKDERIKSCNDSHRKKTLENLALMYQLFKGEAVTDEEAEKRQKAIWAIFDQYYRESTDDSGEDFKTWRLFLARMDRRKMNPTFEEVDEGLQINLNPEVDPGLKEYSEVALQESSEAMKYLSLKLWADYKVKNDEKYKEYTKYEENPKQALKEVKQILEKLKKSDVEFQLSNKAIPAHVCTVLVRDYFEELSKSEMEFCKDVILTFASSSFRPNYMYQIWDGVEAAISVLPLILEKFPEEKEYIKGILLLTLFDSHSIGMYKKFSDYSAETILNNLWDISYDDAQSLLLGFLYLKPKYDEMRESMRQEHPKQNKYKLYENELIETFIREYEKDIERVITNSITLDEIKYIKSINLCILRTAFQLIPLNNYDESHKIITQHIITAFAEKLLSNDREDIVDYEVSHDFLRKFSRIVLTSHRDDVFLFLQPFIESFNNNEPMADLFEEFILAEDILRTYDNFWLVWDLFYDKVAELSKGESYYNQKIIKSYLFASIPWNEDVSEWHAFKDNNKRFLSKVARKMGESPSVLYSIAKLLNGVGQKYLNNGITWISKLLIENNNIWAAKLEENTTYHLENLVKSYIYKNRERIKRETKLKQEVLVILNFLVEKGSVAGYMLRENVL